MTRRLLVLIFLGGLLAGATLQAPLSRAMTLPQVISAIRDSGGHYRWASATLAAADCSGLVSVAQTLAMGQQPHRLGDTHTLFAGQWPDVIDGASPDDAFIIAANPSHMMASIQGIGIEATTSGRPYLVGASSVWDPRFTKRVHVDEKMLILS
jgi:hypothetical protein